MADIIKECMQAVPQDRPTARQIFTRLKRCSKPRPNNNAGAPGRFGTISQGGSSLEDSGSGGGGSGGGSLPATGAALAHSPVLSTAAEHTERRQARRFCNTPAPSKTAWAMLSCSERLVAQGTL